MKPFCHHFFSRPRLSNLPDGFNMTQHYPHGQVASLPAPETATARNLNMDTYLLSRCASTSRQHGTLLSLRLVEITRQSTWPRHRSLLYWKAKCSMEEQNSTAHQRIEQETALLRLVIKTKQKQDLDSMCRSPSYTDTSVRRQIQIDYIFFYTHVYSLNFSFRLGHRCGVYYTYPIVLSYSQKNLYHFHPVQDVLEKHFRCLHNAS